MSTPIPDPHPDPRPHPTTPPRRTKRARSKLGRGLSALVEQGGGAPIRVPNPTVGQNTNTGVGGGVSLEEGADRQVVELDVLHIRPNPHQPRRFFSDEAIEELAQSIVEHGLMQPIVVRWVGDGVYELIAGERRWRASVQAGQPRIRAIVLDADDLQSAQLALIENIQREDLNPIERANGFARLVKNFSMTQAQIAAKVGISRSSVANLLRLIELDEEIQTLIASGELSAGHGKALLSCNDPDRRLKLAQQALKDGWNVRLLENMAASNANQNTSETPMVVGNTNGVVSRVESVLKDLEDRLGEELGTKVKLKTDRSGTKGCIVIEFYDLDHFDGLLNRLGVRGTDELSE